MISQTLSASQENIPDLTDDQLKLLGFENNHIWKLNAKMLGFTPHNEYDIDDFIEEKIGTKTKTFVKGNQIILFYFKGSKVYTLNVHSR